MRRVLLACFLMLIGTMLFTVSAFQAHLQPENYTEVDGKGHKTGRDSPPDLNSYVRKAIPEDFTVNNKLLATSIFLRDTVISNTDATLTNTDTFGDSEPTIAINPSNPNEIVISAFSGGWGNPQSNSPLWHSTDGGNTWTK